MVDNGPHKHCLLPFHNLTHSYVSIAQFPLYFSILMSFKHSDSQLGAILLLWDIRQCPKTFLVNHNWEGITGRGQGCCEHPPTRDISSVLTHTQQRINRPNMLIVMMLRSPDLGRDIFEEKCKYRCMYTYIAISLKGPLLSC